LEEVATWFTTALIFRIFNHDREVIIETDACNYYPAVVMSQRDDEELYHPVVCFSKIHLPAECNYDIYDMELNVFIKQLEEWRPECALTRRPGN
jgi:hypothetical protein